jgi:hypothetical protein
MRAAHSRTSCYCHDHRTGFDVATAPDPHGVAARLFGFGDCELRSAASHLRPASRTRINSVGMAKPVPMAPMVKITRNVY